MVEAWIVIFFYFVIATTLWSVVTWAWVHLRSVLRDWRERDAAPSPRGWDSARLTSAHDAPGGSPAHLRKAARIVIAYGVVDVLIVLLCVVAYLVESGGFVGELIAYGLIITLVHVLLCLALHYSKRKKLFADLHEDST